MAISIDLAIGSSAASGGGGGGSVNTGVLQVSGGGALSGTLQTITDQSSNTSPLQLSTASVSFGGSTGLNWDNTNKRLGIGTNTPLGILHLKTAAASTRLLLDGDAAQNKIITYRTAGVQRFGLYTNNTAESGSNAGSDFAIRAYSDAGTLLSTPLFIKRSTGNVAIGQTSGTAKLTIKGTGDTIAAFLSNAGAQVASISDNGTIACQFLSVSNLFSATSLQSNTIIPQVNGDISIINTWAGSTGVSIRTIANKAQVLTITPDTTNTLTTGTSNIVNVLTPFAPTSGTGVINAISVSGIINQTGGANGITRGLFINPTLTSAADFRAVSTNFTFAAPASSSHLFRGLDLNYTINNGVSQSGTATGIFLNATETGGGLNGMGHNLMDLQVGAVSVFRVSPTNNGTITFGNTTTSSGGMTWRRYDTSDGYFGFYANGITPSTTNYMYLFKTDRSVHQWNGTSSVIFSFEAESNQVLRITNPSGNALISFNGTGPTFPAIRKGSGAVLEIVTANGAGFANLSCGALTTAGELTLKRSDNSEVMTFGNTPNILDFGASLTRVRFQSQTVAINSVPDASAALTIASTTKGFLPPRMTEAQRDLISAPAAGLIVYNTTTNLMNFFNGTIWMAF